MKTYRIEVVEMYSRFVEVDAKDVIDAFEQVEEEYCMGEIAIDYSDAKTAKLVYCDENHFKLQREIY